MDSMSRSLRERRAAEADPSTSLLREESPRRLAEEQRREIELEMAEEQARIEDDAARERGGPGRPVRRPICKTSPASFLSLGNVAQSAFGQVVGRVHGGAPGGEGLPTSAERRAARSQAALTVGGERLPEQRPGRRGRRGAGLRCQFRPDRNRHRRGRGRPARGSSESASRSANAETENMRGEFIQSTGRA